MTIQANDEIYNQIGKVIKENDNNGLDTIVIFSPKKVSLIGIPFDTLTENQNNNTMAQK